MTKGNRAVGTIFRGLRTREAPILWNAFLSYVVSLLEYASQCWNPKLKKNIKSIESIQKRFTKRLAGMSQFSYNERLVALSATTLEIRRNVADLTFVFKCLHGLVDVKPKEICLELQHGITRGAGVHLHQPTAVNCRACLCLGFLLYGTHCRRQYYNLVMYLLLKIDYSFILRIVTKDFYSV